MMRHRGRRQVEFPARSRDLDGVVRAFCSMMFRLLVLSFGLLSLIVAVFALLLLLGMESRPRREEVYVVPHRDWIRDLQVTCSGGDTFEVGHVVTTWSNWPDNVRRDAAPYFLIWHSAHSAERTYPLAVGGYTFAEVGWGADLRAWWSPEGRVKRIWVVARPAMPNRQSLVLGALDTETGEYWSLQDWRNHPEVPWRARDVTVLTWANPMASRALRGDCPRWAQADGGQVLSWLAVPESWEPRVAAADGVERGRFAPSIGQGGNWDQRMAGDTVPGLGR